MSIDPQVPTVVLGAGDAGTRMLSRLSEMLEDENYDRENFLLLAINTHERPDIKGVKRDEQNRIALSVPEDWETKQILLPYLSEDDPSPREGGGVRRNRNVARATVEDEVNLTEVASWLRNCLTNFTAETDELDIWVLNGLGGGTGSGIAPILLALLQVMGRDGWVTKNMRCLSTVPRLADVTIDPIANSRTVPNAFAALAELESLLDPTSVHSEEEQTIDLPLEKYPLALSNSDGLPLKRDDLAEYYLLGVDEERLNRESGTYVEEVEKTAAFTILAKAVSDDTIPDDVVSGYDGRILRAFDVTECELPYEEIATYVTREVDVHRLRNDRERLRELVGRIYGESTGLLEEHERMIDRAKNVRSSAENIGNKALEAAFDETKTSFGDDEIDMYLQWSELQNARTKIEDDGQDRIDIDKPDYTELRSTFDGVEDIRDQITHDGFRPELPGEYLSESGDNSKVLPSRYVIESLYFVAVRQEVWERVKEERDEFENALETLYEHDQVRPKMDQQQRDEFNNAANATERWEHVLSDFIDDRADYLNEKVDIYPLTDLDALAAELRSEKQNVENKKADYEEWKELHRILNEIVESKQSVLRDLSKNYEEWQDSIRDDIEGIDYRIDQVKKSQETVQARLQEESGTQKFRKVPIESPADLIIAYFRTYGKSLLERVEELKDEYETADATDPDKEAIRRHLRNELTIQDLVSGAIVDRDEVYGAVIGAMDSLEQRVVKGGSFSDTMILPISHPEDDWFEATGTDSYTDWARAVDMTAASFPDEEPDFGTVVKRGCLRLLSVNPDVELDNTQIYDTMRTWYETGRLIDLIDSSAEDPEDVVNWAYPELADHVVDRTAPE